MASHVIIFIVMSVRKVRAEYNSGCEKMNLFFAVREHVFIYGLLPQTELNHTSCY